MIKHLTIINPSHNEIETSLEPLKNLDELIIVFRKPYPLILKNPKKINIACKKITIYDLDYEEIILDDFQNPVKCNISDKLICQLLSNIENKSKILLVSIHFKNSNFVDSFYI